MRATAFAASSESQAAQRALALGYRVAIPLFDDGVDLVIEYRPVQVKSSRQPRGSACYAFGSTSRAGVRRPPLLDAPADVFIFYGHEHDAWWVIPREALVDAGVGDRSLISLSASPAYRSRFSALAVWRDAWRQVFGEGP